MLKDALRTVAVYHVDGNPHSETMLMVHLPAERVLVQVDAFSPGSQDNGTRRTCSTTSPGASWRSIASCRCMVRWRRSRNL